MKEINLSQGYITQIDDDDYDFINQWKWSVAKIKGTYYALRSDNLDNGKRKSILIHRVIMNAPKGIEVDHIDHDGLNNQKFNLRLCTCAENRRNKKPASISGYLGVSQYYRNGHKYIKAAIMINGKNKHIGLFPTEEIAARAYDLLAKEYFGEFANLNFKN